MGGIFEVGSSDSASGLRELSSSSDDESEEIGCGLAGADLRLTAAVELWDFLGAGSGGLKAGALRLVEGFARSISWFIVKKFATGVCQLGLKGKFDGFVVSVWDQLGIGCELYYNTKSCIHIGRNFGGQVQPMKHITTAQP